MLKLMIKMNKKDKKLAGFTEEEKAAMRETIRDKQAEARGQSGESLVLAKIAELSGQDKTMAMRIHELITKNVPQLTPKTWYGMPAYANKDGKVVCFFQSAGKFKARYATLGFSDLAKIDEGNMWSTSFALKKLTPNEEKRIVELVKKAV